MTFNIVIAGRPNVGKSTLFNRLAQRKLAIVHPIPGVTRDRKEINVKIGGHKCMLADTAGLEEGEEKSLTERMTKITLESLIHADLILFVVDAISGVTPLDKFYAQHIHELGKNVLLVVNKCESRNSEAGFYDAYELGFGDPLEVAAEHGIGFGDLLDEIITRCKDFEQLNPESLEEEEEEDAQLQFAIIGRPNVGKSTLINKLIGEDRLLTGPEAGITRDVIQLDWHPSETDHIKIIDTAGMRRRANVTESLEKSMVSEATRAVRFTQVVGLVIDAEELFLKQDLQIASYVHEEGRAMVILANKWDKIKNKKYQLEELKYQMDCALPQFKGIPILPISAKTGFDIDKIYPAVLDIYEHWNKRISTGQLNQWLKYMVEKHPPPLAKGRRVKIKYITQIKNRPPRFALWVSQKDALPESYLRYLSNGLRSDFNIQGTPIKLFKRAGKNPYAKK